MMQDPRSELSRRRLLQMLGTLSAAGAVAGCAGPGSTGGDDEPTPTTAAPEAESGGALEGDLSFAHWRGEDQEVFDEVIALFAEANPDVNVRQDIQPSGDYQSTALQRIRGGEVGDVFVAFRGAQFVDMVSAGLYADLSAESWAGNFQPSLITPGQADGTQFGFPYQLVFNMIVYNADLLEQAGYPEPPLSWDGFHAMCEALLGLGVVPIAFPGANAGNAGQLFNSMFMNNAPAEDAMAQIESGDLKATDDWFVQTLEQYAELRPYVQPNATGTDVEPMQQMFAQGDAAMLSTGSYHIAAVRALGAEFPMNVLSPITVGEGEAAYEGVHNTTFILGVNSQSDNAAAATEFMAHLADPEVAGVYANGTAQHVTVQGVEYTDPDLQALAPWLERPTSLAMRFQFNDLDVRSAVEESAILVIGGTDPQQAAEDAQRIVDQRIS